ncbi:MAG: peptide deformylase [Patescibacteria group bacterium]|jgi:peptide deformylase
MATIFKLVTLPDARLRQKSELIPESRIHEPTFVRYLDNLIATMWHADGIGIASVQIGEMIRAVVITRGDEPIVLINPEISYRSLRRQSSEEGCLSVPGFFGPVRRNYRVRVRALDRKGAPIMLDASGLLARIIQHEVDHTNGILFVDRTRKVYATN